MPTPWLTSLLHRHRSQRWLLAHALDSWPDPVGLYLRTGDDFLIQYQNPAAIKDLGFDPTGRQLCEVFPNHRESTGSSFGADPDARLIDAYLSVALTGIPWAADLAYLADGVEGWYRTRAQRIEGDSILITWADVSAEKISIEQQATFLRVQRGLIAHEFVLHYQPIIALDSGKTAGFEALVRWPRSDGTIRPPGEFLPAIANTELINTLAWQVVSMACAELVRWNDKGINQGLYLAINIAPFTVGADDFESRINTILDRHNAPRSRILVEITEEAALGMQLLPRLERLSLSGVLIGIDDFGTGATSLGTLHQIPYATLIKIDRAFIHDVTTNITSQKLVRAIVALASELGMAVAGEGVEDAATAEWLAAAGVTYGQGYWWSKPGPDAVFHTAAGQ
jgi:EAL domain-containing protein (putative c-di-GMP-specific phosphodiesterase class I)